jgi:hypothetical protein
MFTCSRSWADRRIWACWASLGRFSPDLRWRAVLDDFGNLVEVAS